MSAKKWPADEVSRWKVSKLIPSARNARTHSDEQVAQLAASMKEWGWTNPVLVDEQGGIIAGHGRVLAARQLGLTDIPVMTARGWTEHQKRAYMLADNKLALNASWDHELLKIELSDLRETDFDLSLIGFSPEELEMLEGQEVDADPEEQWQGMPEFQHEDKTSAYELIVHFATIEDKEEFGRIIGQAMTERTRAIWHPKAEVNRTADRAYAARANGADYDA